MKEEPKYQPGQTVFLSGANEGLIQEAEIIKFSGGLYTLKLKSGGGTRVRESRIFPTKDAAEAEIRRRDRLLEKIDQIHDIGRRSIGG